MLTASCLLPLAPDNRPKTLFALTPYQSLGVTMKSLYKTVCSHLAVMNLNDKTNGHLMNGKRPSCRQPFQFGNDD